MSEWLTRSSVGRVALLVTHGLTRRWSLAARVDALAARVDRLAARLDYLADELEEEQPRPER